MPHVVESVRGKTLLIIDDSIVRGNNIKREKELLDEVQSGRIYHANYTPPIGVVGDDNIPRGCMFGVDMPPDDDFIARKHSVDEISRITGVHMIYISVAGMFSVFERLGMPKENLCTYCIGGKHPFTDEQPTGLRRISHK